MLDSRDMILLIELIRREIAGFSVHLVHLGFVPDELEDHDFYEKFLTGTDEIMAAIAQLRNGEHVLDFLRLKQSCLNEARRFTTNP